MNNPSSFLLVEDFHTPTPPWMSTPSPEGLNGNPLSFLLLVAVGFIVMAAIGIIRGHILKERIYKIGGLAFTLMALACVSLSFAPLAPSPMIPLVVTGGFFATAAILVFANYSKFFEANFREAENAAAKTDPSKPFKFSDIFMWDGWFKIVKTWGTRKALLLYVLVNLCAGSLIPLVLWIFNIGSTSFVAFITIVMILVVVIASIPLFYLQIIRNMETAKDNCKSDPYKPTF